MLTGYLVHQQESSETRFAISLTFKEIIPLNETLKQACSYHWKCSVLLTARAKEICKRRKNKTLQSLKLTIVCSWALGQSA